MEYLTGKILHNDGSRELFYYDPDSKKRRIIVYDKDYNILSVEVDSNRALIGTMIDD